jgi:DNA-binding CsgD family transcriptional regulator
MQTTSPPDGPPLHLTAVDAPQAGTGFLVTTATFEFLYANRAAIRILSFPREGDEPAAIERRIRSLFPLQRDVTKVPPEAAFLSGQRKYVCRPFLLDQPASKVRQASVGLLLLRPSGQGEADLRQRFHLSPRQSEAVRHVIAGRTTKEMAWHMHVSPHTVKQYLRVVMCRMGVTTRAGIAGKIVTG